MRRRRSLLRNFFASAALKRLQPLAKARVVKWLTIHKRRELSLEADLAKCLAGQHARVIAALHDLVPENSGGVLHAADAAKLVRVEEFAKELMAVANRHILRGMVRGGGLAWDAREVAVGKNGELAKTFLQPPKKIMQAISNAFAGTWTLGYWQQTAKSTLNMLQRSIAGGVKAGQSTVEIMRSIVKDSGGLFSQDRALRIARTEITSALNYGHHVVNQELAADPETSVIGKEWVSILDGACRKSHVNADGQKVKSNGLFMVGGYQARFPGDPLLPGAEKIHCRCTTVEVFEFDDGVDDLLTKSLADGPALSEVS